ncbi:MAG: glutathione peroxidase [Ignavibacteriae bacterium HGW-Ignavibacteriae-2]|jgi:glutathione peroxidase|nr:MAG: glutathione peroxidase [Ignavibacteriae bacterium HGW-Ignavibacteriae-2]
MKKNIYDYNVKRIDGTDIKFSEYKNKVLLIVNTASKCGFTSQFEGLQKLYEKYSGKNFTILGFPSNDFANQDPGDNEEIKSFCTINYGVTFPMFSKIEVNGKNTHPLFKYLKSKAPGFIFKQIKWNFTKFLVDRRGNVVNRFSPSTKPVELESHIENIL